MTGGAAGAMGIYSSLRRGALGGAVGWRLRAKVPCVHASRGTDAAVHFALRSLWLWASQALSSGTARRGIRAGCDGWLRGHHWRQSVRADPVQDLGLGLACARNENKSSMSRVRQRLGGEPIEIACVIA
jgi:hypothetical protein